MSGSRSIAAARSRRAGEQSNIVSGGRPVTSIASQSAFANQQYTPQQQHQQQYQQQQQQQQQQYQQQQLPQPQPFTKLSISTAIGLITLRLGRIEQMIIDKGIDNINPNPNSCMDVLPENSKIIDNSILVSMINRLDSLEKKEQTTLNLEKVIQLQTELNSTKETLLKLTSQIETFMKETSDKLIDFEAGIAEIENTVFVENPDIKHNIAESEPAETVNISITADEM